MEDAVANVFRMLSACFTADATSRPPPAVERTTNQTSGVKPCSRPSCESCVRSASSSVAADGMEKMPSCTLRIHTDGGSCTAPGTSHSPGSDSHSARFSIFSR
eukprot:scaffold5781_cov124-Isochrysis_galbana.AAC.19